MHLHNFERLVRELNFTRMSEHVHVVFDDLCPCLGYLVFKGHFWKKYLR